MVLIKNLKFCEGVVLCKIQPGKVFGDVLVRKQAFLANRNTDLKRNKIGIFVHDFGEKVEVFSSFVFIKNRARKSVC